MVSYARFKLLLHLITSPRTPTELASLEGKHLSQVSKQLGEMKRMGLVEARSSGSRERYYRLTSEGYLVYTMALRNLK